MRSKRAVGVWEEDGRGGNRAESGCGGLQGVHLSMENVAHLMSRHPSCIPFLVYISNADKHRERFAVRAKYMALDASNR